MAISQSQMTMINFKDETIKHVAPLEAKGIYEIAVWIHRESDDKIMVLKQLLIEREQEIQKLTTVGSSNYIFEVFYDQTGHWRQVDVAEYKSWGPGRRRIIQVIHKE